MPVFQESLQYILSCILQLTPALGVVCCLLIAFVTEEPPRGMAEDGLNHESKSSVKEDLIALSKK